MVTVPWLLLGACLWALPASAQSIVGGSAGGSDQLRIEQEDKLLVPLERAEAVWRYMLERLHEDKEFLASLDPGFTSSWSEEWFEDTYFDTPSMELHRRRDGIRHRRRRSLSDPSDRKSGRQLMQIKLSSISDNPLERGEIKFDIETGAPGAGSRDRHPLLGRIKRKDREAFWSRLERLDLDPLGMRPILTVLDLRRRVYISKDGHPFMSISHDQASARVWWGSTRFCEIEPELNEIAFTEADAPLRAYMESRLQAVVADLRTRFPEIRQDLTPKYNKSFDAIERQVPFLRIAVRTGLHDDGPVLLSLAALAVLGGAAAGVRRLLLRRAQGPAGNPSPRSPAAADPGGKPCSTA